MRVYDLWLCETCLLLVQLCELALDGRTVTTLVWTAPRIQ